MDLTWLELRNVYGLKILLAKAAVFFLIFNKTNFVVDIQMPTTRLVMGSF